jgi:hypothetical protein
MKEWDKELYDCEQRVKILLAKIWPDRSVANNIIYDFNARLTEGARSIGFATKESIPEGHWLHKVWWMVLDQELERAYKEETSPPKQIDNDSWPKILT